MKDSFPAGRVREGDRQRLQGRQGDREDTQPVPAALQGGARPRRHPELPPEGGLRHERRVGSLPANPGRMNNLSDLRGLIFARYSRKRDQLKVFPRLRDLPLGVGGESRNLGTVFSRSL